jgi:ABC-type sulfate transport system permease subunit
MRMRYLGAARIMLTRKSNKFAAYKVMPSALPNASNVLQVDTPGKKLLVGVAVTYVLTVLLVPTANIFIQVGQQSIFEHDMPCSAPVYVSSAAMLWLTHLFVTVQAFANGFGPFFDQLSDPDFLHAVRMFSGPCLAWRTAHSSS